MPDWRFQPCDFSAHGFFVSDRINRMDKMTSENVNGEHSVDSVHSVEKPLPNSRRTYVGGKAAFATIRVPFREISLAPTKSMNGEIEMNEPVRVYDTSGPWGDPDFHGDVTQGLPPLRAKWIRERGDVEDHCGSRVQPIDDGYLSRNACRACASAAMEAPNPSSRLQSNFKPQTQTVKLRRAPTSAGEARQTGYAISVTRARESSRPKWNSSPSVRIWGAHATRVPHSATRRMLLQLPAIR